MDLDEFINSMQRILPPVFAKFLRFFLKRTVKLVLSGTIEGGNSVSRVSRVKSKFFFFRVTVIFTSINKLWLA